MAFVSYAQNFEDLMLWRALGHVAQGRYVDIGAQHPVVDSVSKAFHERGWRGVHVEPVPHYAELLRRERPGDTVLEMALSDQPGELELHVIDGTGLSTGVTEHARSHAVKGHASRPLRVPVSTLAQVLAPLEAGPLHWLKIDVEGMEERVLRGWDSRRVRPWIIVVEATVPLSSRPDHAAWEPLLLAADYAFVYFDGLNRFYVAREHMELAGAFTAPPNVFDGACLAPSSPFSSHAARARETLAWEAAVTQARVESAQARGELETLRHSASWRFTAPLRAAADMARAGIAGFKTLVKKALRKVWRVALRRPSLRPAALAWLERMPGAVQRAVWAVPPMPPGNSPPALAEVADPRHLPPRARAVYDALRRARESAGG